MANEHDPEIVHAVYISGDGPELRIPRETILDLIALADEGSTPGSAVPVSRLVNEALDDYLAERRKALAKIDEQAQADELERVFATHGGGEAA
jgi:hypothetical protein